jgi:DNA-binding CsgD family transcriptional regulator
MVYAYVSLSSVTALLLLSIDTFRHVYRRQAVIAAAMILPWVANIMYVLDLGPFPGMDFTPYGFAISAVLLGWSISRWRFLRLAPVARHRVVEEMQHGGVVLDDQHIIIDLNPAAQHTLGLTPEMIGSPLQDHFAPYADLMAGADSRRDLQRTCQDQSLCTLSVGHTPLALDLVGQLLVGITDTDDASAGLFLLSSQQLDVLRGVAQGDTYEGIPERMHLSRRTVQYHMDQIREKLDVQTRAQAVTRAFQLGIVSPDKTLSDPL